ncbi:MAG: hypothetical protein KOO63_05620 [Bacteroidales bacterium]|nr:hypothetical protein [Candidatus Latescibacterota bacterium]
MPKYDDGWPKGSYNEIVGISGQGLQRAGRPIELKIDAAKIRWTKTLDIPTQIFDAIMLRLDGCNNRGLRIHEDHIHRSFADAIAALKERERLIMVEWKKKGR